jgi:hypothetical protein
MENQSWLDKLRDELVSQGLPPLYIERLLGELRDHIDDIAEEGLSMEPEKSRPADERLGQPAELAETVAGEYSRGAFPLTISRKRILNLDLVGGIVAGLVLVAGVVGFAWYTSEWLALVGFLFVPVLAYFGLRRFLRSITFDSERKMLIARSIFPWVTFTIPFGDVRVVRRVKRYGGYNLAVRRLRNIQPLLFEVWTPDEDREVQSLMTMLLSQGVTVAQ